MPRSLVISLVLLALAPSQSANAGAWGQLSGKTTAGSLVVITDETRSGSPAIILSTATGDVEFPFKAACSFEMDTTSEPPKTFSCKPNGKSPLAGTTYQRIGPIGKCKPKRFQCVQGCKASAVPSTLVYQPWEC